MESITDITTLERVLAGGRVVALCHATWCPHCRAFRPEFERLAPEVSGWAAIEVLLDDEGSPLWDRLGLETVPTVLFLDGERVVRRLVAEPGVGLRLDDFRRALAELTG